MQQRIGNLDNTSLERRIKYKGNGFLILTKIRWDKIGQELFGSDKEVNKLHVGRLRLDIKGNLIYVLDYETLEQAGCLFQGHLLKCERNAYG